MSIMTAQFAAANTAHKRKMLVVDDDSMLCDMLVTLFSEHGFEVECRHDGGEAMGAIWDFNPDIFIVDSVLPHTPGIEIVNHVRTSGLIKNLPIIVIGGHGSRVEHRAMRAGADAFLRKPFDPDDIVAMVMRLVPELSFAD